MGRTIFALGFSSEQTYDAGGNVLTETDANNHTTTSTYDDAGQLTVTTYPDNTTSQTGYDKDGRQVTKTDQNGYVTQYGYDFDGRLSSVTDPMGFVTRYAYDEIGEKISQTDANGHTTKFAYDSNGCQIQKTLPAGQHESMTYNADGTTASQTDYNGLVTAFDYDLNGRLLDKKNAAGSILAEYSYYADGSKETASLGGAETRYNYDPLGRLNQVAGPVGTIGYGLDDDGSVTSEQLPSGTITNAYDSDNRLHTVTAPDQTQTGYGYDNAGNVTSETRPNGVSTSRTYDSLNRLTNISNFSGTTQSPSTINAYRYTLDAGGRRNVVAESGSASTKASTMDQYDADGRLLSENGPAGNISYTYDNVGNRLTKTVDGATTTYHYDSGGDDRLTSETTNGITTNYQYDANGNLWTAQTGSTTLTYEHDFEDHLTEMDSTTGGVTTPVAQYSYDADGNRLSETTSNGTTNFLVDSALAYPSVVEERDGSGNLLASYDYGDDLLRMDRWFDGVATPSYYLFDGLGSTRALTSATGALTDTDNYDAYGNLVPTLTTGSTPNEFLYNGQQFDPVLGDYYLRARYYDEADGRFISQDPYEGDDQEPVSLHRYLYCADDPVDATDFGGMDFDDYFGDCHGVESCILTTAAVLQWDNDSFGGQIIQHYLTGGGRALQIYDNPAWTSYLEHNHGFTGYVENALYNLTDDRGSDRLKPGEKRFLHTDDLNAYTDGPDQRIQFDPGGCGITTWDNTGYNLIHTVTRMPVFGYVTMSVDGQTASYNMTYEMMKNMKFSSAHDNGFVRAVGGFFSSFRGGAYWLDVSWKAESTRNMETAGRNTGWPLGPEWAD